MSYSVEQLLTIALAEEGYLEKASNSNLYDKTANPGKADYTKYAYDLYKAGYYNGNKNGYAWCDVFVDWCHYMASGKDATIAQKTICQSGPLGAGCPYSMKYYKDANRFFKVPLPGDQIFFRYRNSQNEADHTGIVYKVDSNYVYTIEGNTSYNEKWEKVTPGVHKLYYSLSDTIILGYGRPLYSNTTQSIFVPEVFNQNTEAVQSATRHNFFSIKAVEIQSLSGTFKISTNEATKYSWYYTVTNGLTNTSVIKNQAIRASALSNFKVTNLKPYTPYCLEIKAVSDSFSSVQQVFFVTTKGSISDPEAVVAQLESDKTLKISFNILASLKDIDATDSIGYRLSLIVNGCVVSYKDFVNNSSTGIVSKTIMLSDFCTEISYEDSFQIGVQTWLKNSNRLLLSNAPICSAVMQLPCSLKKIHDLYVSTENGHKMAVIWLNNN